MDGAPRTFVALVDDEEPVRKAISRALRLLDFEVDSFSSGHDFLDSLARKTPACAVVDLQMPGMSGLEVQARLREGGFTVPVILITASDAASLHEQARSTDVVCLLHKPFTLQALRDAIGQAMR